MHVLGLKRSSHSTPSKNGLDNNRNQRNLPSKSPSHSNQSTPSSSPKHKQEVNASKKNFVGGGERMRYFRLFLAIHYNAL